MYLSTIMFITIGLSTLFALSVRGNSEDCGFIDNRAVTMSDQNTMGSLRGIDKWLKI
jgi:hypothetical protein